MPSYLNGLYLGLTPSGEVEAFAAISTVGFLTNLVYHIRRGFVIAKKGAGEIKNTPNPAIMTPTIITHFATPFVPAVAYIVTVWANGGERPAWLKEYALPGDVSDVQSVEGAKIAAIRLIASVGSIGLAYFLRQILNHLGAQWDFIGVREKPKLVQSGAYGYVRHPFYTTLLAQQLLQGLMFWSYIPIVTLPITAAAFAFKMPIEESLIEKSEDLGEQYKVYKRKVTARIIPFIW